MPPDPEIHYVYIHDFPSHIDISKDFNIHIIGYIFGYIKVDKSPFQRDIQGTVTLEKKDLPGEISFPCRIETKQYKFFRYIDGTVTHGGKLKYENSYPGSVTLVRGKHTTEIPGTVSLPFESKTYMSGIARMVLNGNNDIDLDSSIKILKKLKAKDLDGNVSLKYEDTKQDLPGSLDFIKDKNTTDLYGSIKLNELYSAAQFLCRIKVPKLQYIYSILSHIQIVDKVDTEIPSSIIIKDDYMVKKSIDGKVGINSIESKYYIGGKLELTPFEVKYVDGTVSINSVYTRKEFNATMFIVNREDIDIDCHIELKEGKRHYGHIDTIDCKIIAGEQYRKELNCSLSLMEDEKQIKREEKFRTPRGRIVIVVSPTWRYEALVFKNSLITFLDKYYHKYSFDILFGGNPRSDWDIINLSRAFKIPDYKLMNVPIIADYHHPLNTKHSIDHFINHMFTFKDGQPKVISRVFLFMNQPDWYINDPLARIAEVCKTNDISCVAIDSGGEYQEITEIDKRRDKYLNEREYDRQLQHMPNNDYHMISKYIDPNRIVY